MKKILKYLFISIFGLGLVLFGVGCALNKPLPEGEKSQEAEFLAKKMLSSVNIQAWDSLKYIQWTFRNNHHYFWDKQSNLVEVKWKKYKAIINTKTERGIVYKNGELLENSQKELKTAIDYFNNDSFWLLAFTKVFDEGTERRIVKKEGERDALLITYNSGGSTPGDSYLWYLDENGLPEKWQMWVSIIPIGGVEMTWSDWTTLYNGAKVAQNHQGSILSIPLTNIVASENLADFGRVESLFLVISRNQ